MSDFFDAILGFGTGLNNLIEPDVRKYRLKRALISKGKTREEAQAYITVLEAITPILVNRMHIPAETWSKLAPVFAEILNDDDLAGIWFKDARTIANLRLNLRLS